MLTKCASSNSKQSRLLSLLKMREVSGRATWVSILAARSAREILVELWAYQSSISTERLFALVFEITVWLFFVTRRWFRFYHNTSSSNSIDIYFSWRIVVIFHAQLLGNLDLLSIRISYFKLFFYRLYENVEIFVSHFIFQIVIIALRSRIDFNTTLDFRLTLCYFDDLLFINAQYVGVLWKLTNISNY